MSKWVRAEIMIIRQCSGSVRVKLEMPVSAVNQYVYFERRVSQ